MDSSYVGDVERKVALKDPVIKVLRVITRLNIGGPAIHVVNLCKYLPRSKYKHILVFGTLSNYEGDMSYLLNRDIEAIRIETIKRNIFFFDDILSLFKLLLIIKKFNPDIVHTHTAKAGTLGRVAGLILNIFRRKDKRIKLIHTFHGHVFKGYFGNTLTKIFILIERFLALFTDRIIVLSNIQYQEIIELLNIKNKSKVRIIKLGFDLDRFKNIKVNKDHVRGNVLNVPYKDKFLIGMIGRLVSIKNHEMLLETVKILVRKGEIEKFFFIVIGDGEDRARLEALSNLKGISSYIKFVGWKRDIHLIYKALDAVVLTSINEGTPVSVIEAMACGVPVIATEVGGVPDLLGKIEKIHEQGFKITQHGIMIPSNRADILSEAIIYQYYNRRRMEQKLYLAQRYVFQNFSLDRLIKDMDNLYGEVLKRNGSNSDYYHI